MINYLHIQSDEPIVTSDEYVNAYRHKCTSAYDMETYVLPIIDGKELRCDSQPGTYALHPRVHKHYVFSNRFILTKALLNQLHARGDQWRTQRIRLLGKYNALITHPNEAQYWQALICDIIAYPHKYPTPTGLDKLLFVICWNGAGFFQHNLRAKRDNPAQKPVAASDATDSDSGRTKDMAHLVPPTRRIVKSLTASCYSHAQYAKLWKNIVTGVRS